MPALDDHLRRVFPACAYDLGATLSSGQAFRWRPENDAWVGVVCGRWVRLCSIEEGISAEVAEPTPDWQWLANYLQVDVDLDSVLKTFPKDEPLQAAVAACNGLRLLRQDPWECLASFILSSTKQIVQIQQIVSQLCSCFGEPLPVPSGQAPAFAFPLPARLAEVSEAGLRACKMGFRAPYLRSTAREVAEGRLNLDGLRQLPLIEARDRLMELPGVGRKIADCVLLFAYGIQAAFPVDVWVIKGLRQLYFRKRKVNLKRLQRFTESHFGPNAGYAQQYLFHYLRVGRPLRTRPRT